MVSNIVRAVHYDLDELETAVVAVYAAQLPIPAWWPDEERAAFIADHAGDALGALTTQLNDVVDRTIDQAARSPSANGWSYSADEISVLIDISDDYFSHLPYFIRNVGKTQLPQEMIGKVGFPGEKLLK